jgi:two-component system chemotaxis response regulator CheB
VTSAKRRSSEQIINDDLVDQQRGGRNGDVSVYSCPDCGGTLWQIDRGHVVEFQCHIGHEWAADTLVAAKSRALEQALMEAVRGLKEKGLLLRQLAAMLNPANEHTAYLIEQADQHDEHARLVQTHLLDGATGVRSIDTSDHVIAQVVSEMRRVPDD